MAIQSIALGVGGVVKGFDLNMFEVVKGFDLRTRLRYFLPRGGGGGGIK